MKKTLERLSKITAPACVTLILQTHKSHPDNEKDVIALKNMIADAHKRLQKEYGAEIAKKYTEKLQQLAEKIDFRQNDNGLMLFVNDEIAEYLRVPIKPHDRIILDTTFATRTIIRALQRSTDYYILVLTKGRARLIEASADTAVKEFEDQGFPVEDKASLSVSKPESSNAMRVSNINQEFFNQVDKLVNSVRSKKPLRVIILSEETNYHDYLKEADHPDTILGRVLLKNFDEKAGNIVKYVWPNVEELTLAKNRSRIAELDQAINNGKYVTDLNDIWDAVQKGRGRTIFVEEGFLQPVKNEDGVLTPISSEEISDKNHINDVVDDIIEFNLKFGGDVVFMPKESLKDFNKMALVTRY